MSFNNKKILIVEDEIKISRLIKQYLSSKNFNVRTANNGKIALVEFEKFVPDLILVDVMMPIINGIEFTRIVRKTSNLPILMLTAKTTKENMIEGLLSGADDYIYKPFDLEEVEARINAKLRRAYSYKHQILNVIKIGIFTLNLDSQQVFIEDREVETTTIQFKILKIFCENPNKIFSRENIMDAIYTDTDYNFDRVIDAHIKNLRKIIEKDPSNPKYIKTIRSSGYKFVC